jgi:UDP-N-acetylmuramyl pentapeptide phosphotransferase/UDP-N-acetylglucosamine-1-phosphate transferase
MSFLWLLSLAISMHPAKTFRGNGDALAIGAVIIVIAWFMDMAVDLREENDLTI